MKKNIQKYNLKHRLKRSVKRVVQTFHMPKKDKGKKIYYSNLSAPIREKYIFYEAFAGLGILDNPRAIFKYLLNCDDFKDFTHVWSIDNTELAKSNISEYSNLSNVIIVKKESSEYYRYLATCKYIFSNSTFGYYFVKRQDQVYINTWHGVPTKYMGYEHTVERVENARGPARNYLCADYLISANRFMTDIMYRRSYKQDGLFEGKLLETGYPRSDALINTNSSYVYDKLKQIGIETDKKIILYAPTWKGNLYNQLDYDVNSFKEIVEKLSEKIDTTQYKIYLRVHYFLYKILATDPELEKILIPFTIDTNELLSVVDILISDYSSIFFDFLATGRSMLFYVPDLKEYESGRGLYVPIKNLPGFVSSDISQISNTLGNICSNETEYTAKYQKLYTSMNSWCIYNDDGLSCKRLVDIIFRGKSLTNAGVDITPLNYEETIDFGQYIQTHKCTQVICGFKTLKEKRLLCINTKCNNDIFFKELKNYLNEINYDTTDVTLLVTSFNREKYKDYFNSLPNEIRILVWYALPFVVRENSLFFKREYVRSVGYAHFDKIEILGNSTEYWENFCKYAPETFITK